MIYSLFGFQYALAPPHSAFTPRVASSRAASRAAAALMNTPAGGDENLAAPPAIEQLENMFALESTADAGKPTLLASTRPGKHSGRDADVHPSAQRWPTRPKK